MLAANVQQPELGHPIIEQALQERLLPARQESGRNKLTGDRHDCERHKHTIILATQGLHEQKLLVCLELEYSLDRRIAVLQAMLDDPEEELRACQGFQHLELTRVQLCHAVERNKF